MNFAAVTSLFGGRQQGAEQETAPRFADFEAAYENHKDIVRRTAYSMGGAEDLDDIVQETFIKAWRAWDSFKGDSSLRTWIYRITVNASREHWRKRGRYKAAIARYLDEPHAQSMDGGQKNWELSRRISAALAGLSYGQREAVTLVYLEGLSLAEAAQATETPEGTLKSRLYHARIQLAGVLGEGDSHE